jgi:DNA-binding NarL/FixJ family response regulator
MIRIAIVEDKPDISAGLCYIISNADGLSCRAFESAEAAINQISPGEFDVVLMDIKLPGMSGIELTKLLKQKYPDLKIMMCTIFEDYEKIYKAIVAGASGYLLKRTEPQILIQSIKELNEGGAPISSAIAQKVLTAFKQMLPKENKDDTLSDRETEVLTLLAEGKRSKEVAEELFINIATVKSHIYNIYQKFHVSSRIEAINKFKSQPKG